MDVAALDHLLTTTRSVRKRLDLRRPVPAHLIEQCIEIALQAPTGSNAQGWHFVVVSEPGKRAAIARLYKEAFDAYERRAEGPRYASDDPRASQFPRVIGSARYLADHLHEVPLHVIPCVEGRVEKARVVEQASVYGSILPAAWSFMLALRARGLGTAWTTLHLVYEGEVAKLLGIPDAVTQVALFPVAFFTGRDFRRAERLPAAKRTHWNAWGAQP
ncbi:MAG TPA: nitroreductase family protein [Myxococcota bacterium]|nr:nitroreductase family protein [Myxococcota bacterium]